ncbi:uncharacterized protein LOC112045632 [Bicyclus anynana]|uniref:Uncharacterized protein LOC112045632 n=1 Tax=Bicyclus anynana TaxID=110368 RepID=A0A6J1MXK8_BICAN|nr:uncharacterized protein LOC112045632 [Bicyclus anynana]
MADKIHFHTNGRTDFDLVLENHLENITKKEGYIYYEIVKRNFNTDGGNFLGVLLEIDVKGKTTDGEKETNLFVKKEIPFEKITVLDSKVMFRKELFVYIDLAKVVTHLQDSAKVPDEDRFKIAKAYPESNEEILIFENLAKKGFKTYGKFDILPLKYIELAIKELGKFHGISFVIEQRMPEFYENKIKTQKSPFNFNDDWKGLMEKIFLYTANLLGGETKRRIEDYLPIAIKKYPMYDNDQTSVRCCLSHVDYHFANILVKENDGEPVEVITIDYQLLDYGCPLRDLLFFIYSATSKDFRGEHMVHLKDLYFETITRYLKYFDMDIEDVYPRKDFEKVYKEWKDYGLIRTLYTSIFLFPPDSGLDVSKLSLSELPYEPSPEVQERVRGWIEEFLEDGYL